MRKTVFAFVLLVRYIVMDGYGRVGMDCCFGSERKSHNFQNRVDDRPGKGLKIREGGVIKITPGRDTPSYRVIGHNCHWILVEGVGIDS